MAQDDSLDRELLAGSLRITTGCQYCAVGCGYNALLEPVKEQTGDETTFEGVSRFITPAMTGNVRYRGIPYQAAVAPDARCDLNKGNHSVRGGSQGHNLVSAPSPVSDSVDGRNRSTKDRLTYPRVRLSDGCCQKITWDTLNEVVARLVVKATGMKPTADESKIKVEAPEALGVKVFEYQYLENTYAATKLFFAGIGTPNAALHDRPGVAGSSPGMKDSGLRPHDFSYEEAMQSDLLIFIGTNPYENQSVFFMQYCAGRPMVVIDPRATATAQYAVKTGGEHIQPARLGGDSVLLYGLCRALLIRWRDHHGTLDNYPWAESIMDDGEIGALRQKADRNTDNEITLSVLRKRRRASRAMTLSEFAEFLLIDDNASPYSPVAVQQVCGIPPTQLHELAERLIDPEKPQEQQPKVGVCYEKGLIWGFNYHNTAAVAALGILLGTGAEPGRFTGRVGGHQKGWAVSKANLHTVFESSAYTYDRNADGHVCCEADYTEGYPFRNVTDTYSDDYIETFEETDFYGNTVPVHHNLDNHVFGPPGVEPQDGDITLPNGVTTSARPDVKLLWIIGCNYLGQTNDAAAKRDILTRRLSAGSDEAETIKRPDPPAEGEELTADAIFAAFESRLEHEDGLVLIHQELFENPTSELCDILIPAAGWGEDDFLSLQRSTTSQALREISGQPSGSGRSGSHPRRRSARTPRRLFVFTET